MVTRHNSVQKMTDELTTRDSNLSAYPEDSKISSGTLMRKSTPQLQAACLNIVYKTIIFKVKA